jgi:hypothetical protein
MIKTFEAFSKDSFELPRSNNPIYAIINTSEYNNDGKASVQQAVGLKECDDLGWRSNDIGINLYTHKECELNDLKVGEIMESVEYKGAYIMRIA